MATYKIVPGQREHIAPIAANIREADENEFIRASGLDVRPCLELGFGHARDVWTGLLDGEPVMMCGVTTMPGRPDVGIPWLVATNDIEKVAKDFHKRSKEILKKMQAGYRGLINYADAENTATLHWLKRLGFTILEPEPYGRSGMPFHRFYLGEVTSV